MRRDSDAQRERTTDGEGKTHGLQFCNSAISTPNHLKSDGFCPTVLPLAVCFVRHVERRLNWIRAGRRRQLEFGEFPRDNLEVISHHDQSHGSAEGVAIASNRSR